MDKRIRRSVVIPSEQKFQPGNLMRKMSTFRDCSLEERDKLEKVSSQTFLQKPLMRARQSTFHQQKSTAWNSDKQLEQLPAPKTHFNLHRKSPAQPYYLQSNQSSRSPSADRHMHTPFQPAAKKTEHASREASVKSNLVRESAPIKNAPTPPKVLSTQPA